MDQAFKEVSVKLLKVISHLLDAQLPQGPIGLLPTLCFPSELCTQARGSTKDLSTVGVSGHKGQVLGSSFSSTSFSKGSCSGPPS